MMTTTKTLLTAGLVLGTSAFAMAAPALAQDDMIALSANVALVSDYRFRGVSLSDEDPAIQGGIDASIGGFYVGTWGSSIEQFNGAETEIDLYGGWGTEFANGMAVDLGFLYYAYPGGTGTNYYEIYASLSGAASNVDWTLGVNYNPDQDNLGDDDDLYLYGDLGYSFADSPFYVGGHFGYEDGALGNPDGFGGSSKMDWSLTAGVTWEQWDVSVSYIDTDEHCGGCDATAVFTVGASF